MALLNYRSETGFLDFRDEIVLGIFRVILHGGWEGYYYTLHFCILAIVYLF